MRILAIVYDAQIVMLNCFVFIIVIIIIIIIIIILTLE